MDVLKDILFPVVDEARQSMGSAQGLERSLEAPLFGEGGLESLDMVRFIVLVEERVEDLSGVQLTLASDQALSRRHSPFATVGTLAAYVEECLAQDAGDG